MKFCDLDGTRLARQAEATGAPAHHRTWSLLGIGLLVGALVGLAQDSLSKNLLGMFGITKTIIGYVAASVGLRLDVEHPLIRLILGFLFFVFHQFIFWALSRGLLDQQVNFETQRTLVLGLLNAIVAVSLFHFLDKLKERA